MVLMVAGGVLLVAWLGKRLGGAATAVGEGVGQGVRGLGVGVAQGAVDVQRTIALGARDIVRDLARGEEVEYDAPAARLLAVENRPRPAWVPPGGVGGTIDSVSIARDDTRTKFEVRWTVGNYSSERRSIGSVAQLHAVFWGSRTTRETPNQVDQLEPGQVRSHAKILEGPLVDAVNDTYVKLFVDGREVARREV